MSRPGGDGGGTSHTEIENMLASGSAEVRSQMSRTEANEGETSRTTLYDDLSPSVTEQNSVQNTEAISFTAYQDSHSNARTRQLSSASSNGSNGSTSRRRRREGKRPDRYSSIRSQDHTESNVGANGGSDQSDSESFSRRRIGPKRGDDSNLASESYEPAESNTQPDVELDIGSTRKSPFSDHARSRPGQGDGSQGNPIYVDDVSREPQNKALSPNRRLLEDSTSEASMQSYFAIHRSSDMDIYASQNFSNPSYTASILERQNSSPSSTRAVFRGPSPIQMRQRGPDFVLPRWQPDAEVTLCPICGTQFSFFVRKHHCRKCGRVVCNACSPHRITIPYQFIVQPLQESSPTTASRPVLDPQRIGSSTDFTSLGGGERVRLCNPCVPDPNIAPPQSPPFDPRRHAGSSHSHSRSVSLATPSYRQSTSQTAMDRAALENTRTIRNYRNPQIIPSQRPSGMLLGASQLSGSAGHAERHGSISDSVSSRSRSSTTGDGYYLGLRPGMASTQSHPQHYRSLVTREAALQSRPLPRPPRLAEEDECPVCHLELPSSTLPNAENLRAAHITQCIESALTGPPPSVPAAATPPQPPSSSTTTGTTATTAPIPNTPESRTAARERAHAAVVLGASSPPPPIRRTGVFSYQATEKDSVDDAECTICLEEFAVGEEMGRLECFCRFHLRCIRQWFERHYGMCPVHQHGGGY